MSALGLESRGPDRLVLKIAEPVIGYVLRRVPDLIEERESPEVRRRFYPDAVPDDPDRTAEWHRLMDSELRHLFEAAGQTMRHDLEGWDPATGEVVFPITHLRAWMSAINQARIVLAEVHGLGAEDISREELDADSPRDRALLQVQVLGYVLQVLVDRALEGT